MPSTMLVSAVMRSLRLLLFVVMAFLLSFDCEHARLRALHPVLVTSHAGHAAVDVGVA
jgi:hypothetical protein